MQTIYFKPEHKKPKLKIKRYIYIFIMLIIITAFIILFINLNNFQKNKLNKNSNFKTPVYSSEYPIPINILSCSDIDIMAKQTGQDREPAIKTGCSEKCLENNKGYYGYECRNNQLICECN